MDYYDKRRCPHFPTHHHHFIPPKNRVRITGQIKLNVDVIDRHGYMRSVQIKNNKRYVIECISATKGRVTFIGKITDFELEDNIELLLQKPYTANIKGIIVDYSTDSEAKIVRIMLPNIVSIRPVNDLWDDEDLDKYFQPPHTPVPQNTDDPDEEPTPQPTPDPEPEPQPDPGEQQTPDPTPDDNQNGEESGGNSESQNTQDPDNNTTQDPEPENTDPEPTNNVDDNNQESGG